MIEVTASLQRGSVYLAGETLECQVRFSNIKNEHSDPSKSETLAWASAQIHCQCSVSESRVVLQKSAALSSSDVSTTGKETSFVPSRGERGLTVLSTPPTILFCDLKLKPGESKTYTYRSTIPPEAPPSFRGTAVKYSYKVTIGTQRFDCPTKLLRVPFRVLVMYGLNDPSIYNDTDEMAPNNPFLKPQRKEVSILDVACQVLQSVTARKSPHYYNISNGKGKVARFCLFKSAYRIGEDIIGLFDFSEISIPCIQLSVTLQSEEQVAEECRRKINQNMTVTVYSKQQEFCLHTKRVHVSIPIPLTATPGFNTDIVCLLWRLHFEFVTSSQPITGPKEPTDPSESATWQGQSNIEVETMVWDLPIKVLPTNPLHAGVASLLRTSNSMAV